MNPADTTVQEGEKTYYAKVVDAVAKIGTEKYETVAAAVAALTENGQTIELIADATNSVAVTPAYDTTFDLGGKTLTANVRYPITVDTGKTLNVTNGTIDLITNLDYTFTVNGTLNVLDGATIKRSYSGGAVLELYAGAVVNVYDGATLVNGDSGEVFRSKNNASTNTVNVYGGVIGTAKASKIVSVYKNQANMTINVSGGTFTGGIMFEVGTSNNSASYDGCYAYLNVNITGGEFTASSKNFNIAIKDGGDEVRGEINCTLGDTCKAKFKIDQGLKDYCASGYGPILQDGWYVIGEQLDPIPPLPAEPTAEDVTNAINSVNYADKAALMAVIGGDATKYTAFKTWADKIGAETVIASSYAAKSFQLAPFVDGDVLFTDEPTLTTTAIAADTETAGNWTFTVKLTDGAEGEIVDLLESIANCAKVSTDLANWSAATATAEINDGIATITITPPEETDKAFMKVEIK